MNIGFKVIENTILPILEKAPAEIQSEMHKSYTDIGGRVVETAQGIVLVRSGATRASIAYKVSDVTVIVYAGTPYARYIEFGTRKWAGKPYLRPALQANLTYVTGKFRDAVIAAMLR